MRFLPNFVGEAVRIEQRFEDERAGLGQQFATALERTVNSIAKAPESFSPLDRTTRVAGVHPFAYGIYYQLEQDGVVVMSLWHLHRRPGSWKRRRKQ